METCNIQNYIKRGKTVILTLRQGPYESGNNPNVRQWTDTETWELVALMKAYLHDFKSQKRRKKEIWLDVSNKLSETGESGSGWTPEDCRKKWSNMIRTLKTIEEQRRNESKNGTDTSKKVKWQYHEKMMDLLQCEGAEALPEAGAVCSFLKDFPLSEYNQQSDSNNGRDLISGDINMVEMGDPVPEGPVDTRNIEESVVETDPLEFYLVDNQDGGVGRTHTESQSIGFDGSADDFHTLATVAAAAATAGDCVSSLATSMMTSDEAIKMKFESVLPITHSVPHTSANLLLGSKNCMTALSSTFVPSSTLSSTTMVQRQVIGSRNLTDHLAQSSPPRTNPPAPAATVTTPSFSSSLTRHHNINHVNHNQASSSNASGYNKRRAKFHRREIKKKPRNSDATTETTGDPLVDKFIAITNKQNEKILQRMEKQHEEAISVMRDRNNILENVLTFLKSQLTSRTPTEPQHSQSTIEVSTPVVIPSQPGLSTMPIRLINAQQLNRANLLSVINSSVMTNATTKKHV